MFCVFCSDNFKRIFIVFIFFIGNSFFIKAQKVVFVNEKNQIIKIFKNYKPVYDSIVARKMIKKYQKRGFINASLDTVVQKGDTIYYRIYQGVSFRYGVVDFQTNDTVFRLKKFRNKKASPDILNTFVAGKKTYLQNKGYPFADVYISKYHFVEGRVYIVLTIDSGKFIVYNKIFFDRKNVKISEKFLENFLNFKQGEEYVLNDIQKIDKKISNSGYWEVLRPSEIEFHDKNCDLYLYLKNKKNNTATGILGFTNKNGKFHVIGQASVATGNLTGHGDSWKLDWNSSPSTGQKLSIYADLPYIANTKFGFTDFLKIEKIDTLFLNAENDFLLKYYFFASDNISFTYSYGFSAPFSNGVNQHNIFYSYAGIGIGFRRIDDIIMPRHGYVVNFSVLAGKSRYGENNFFRGKFLFNSEFYFNFRKNNVIAAKIKSMILTGLNLEENEMFRFGGANSMRGFDEQQFITPAWAVVSLEYHFFTDRFTNFFMFADAGTYLSERQKQQSLLSAGLGMNIKTKAGIFVFELAQGKLQGQAIDLNNAKIHFGLKTTF